MSADLVEERPELRVEVVIGLISRDPVRALVDDHVSLRDDILGLEVHGDLVGVDFDVLILDRDVWLENGVLVFLVLGMAAGRNGELDVALRARLRLDDLELLRRRLFVVLAGLAHVLSLSPGAGRRREEEGQEA